jgi:hypothetical protein
LTPDNNAAFLLLESWHDHAERSLLHETMSEHRQPMNCRIPYSRRGLERIELGKGRHSRSVIKHKDIANGEINSIYHWGIKRHRLRDDAISTTNDVFWLNAVMRSTLYIKTQPGIF